jgi:proline iminopeptidase
VEEVEQVRQALGLNQDNFYLLGHSWGGILAAEYALKYPDNLKGLIISNIMMSCPEYGKYADEVLAKQMEPKVLAEIQGLESKGDFANPRYMEFMQGPREFGISGKLEKWDVTARLPEIKVPTLVIGARHDTMDSAHMKMVSEKVQKGRFLLCPEGSHMSMWDDPAHYFPELISFLKEVDGGRI